MCDPREEIDILLRYGKHPGIVTLKSVYEDSRMYYLVLQLLKGGDLLNYMMKKVMTPVLTDCKNYHLKHNFVSCRVI